MKVPIVLVALTVILISCTTEKSEWREDQDEAAARTNDTLTRAAREAKDINRKFDIVVQRNLDDKGE